MDSPNAAIFSSTTDTEVIVHLYEEQRRLFSARVFAFAIGTQISNLVPRPRSGGIKPLYYCESETFLLVKLKSILSIHRSRDVYAPALRRLLPSITLDEDTLFRSKARAGALSYVRAALHHQCGTFDLAGTKSTTLRRLPGAAEPNTSGEGPHDRRCSRRTLAERRNGFFGRSEFCDEQRGQKIKTFTAGLAKSRGGRKILRPAGSPAIRHGTLRSHHIRRGLLNFFPLIIRRRAVCDRRRWRSITCQTRPAPRQDSFRRGWRRGLRRMAQLSEHAAASPDRQGPGTAGKAGGGRECCRWAPSARGPIGTIWRCPRASVFFAILQPDFRAHILFQSSRARFVHPGFPRQHLRARLHGVCRTAGTQRGRPIVA